MESKSSLSQSTSAAVREAKRLEALLEITADWNQTRNTDELLEQIALASTRLLAAERATIFLPAATGNMLIGKPALGVEGNELLISADAGLVGQVMQNGQADRVDEDISAEQNLVNRDVDQQLGFETRSLLCVPMIDDAGKTIGAFEVINRTHGN